MKNKYRDFEKQSPFIISSPAALTPLIGSNWFDDLISNYVPCKLNPWKKRTNQHGINCTQKTKNSLKITKQSPVEGRKASKPDI